MISPNLNSGFDDRAILYTASNAPLNIPSDTAPNASAISCSRAIFRAAARILAAAMLAIALAPAATAQSDAVAPANANVNASASAAAITLRDKYASLSDKLANNQFQRPLYIDSDESPSSLKGDIYAVVNFPFATVNTALNGPKNWCDVLILHLNVKFCQRRNDGDGAAITVNLGKKTPEALDDTYRVAFKYHAEAAQPDYFSVGMSAAEGPLNTSNYRIHLEAVSIDTGRTFLHLTYSYSYGFAGKVAMKAYLATIGSDKVGFTRSGSGTGKAAYVNGVRGVVERNTMRYYLAIDAYLSAMNAPTSEQFEKRLQTWFSATERYPQQLHEVERTAYIAMKHDEFQRQNTVR